MSSCSSIIGQVKVKPHMFRIGAGYVDYWIHEMRGHWRTSDSEDSALLDLEGALLRLLKKRDAVESARRGFAPASSLVTDDYPANLTQETLFEATQDFFLTFYATLSSFASFFSRFNKELGSNVPHRSNQKFIDWLRPFALFREEAIPLLEEARNFRTLLDHKADHLPYEWGTVDAQGLVRIILHGPASSKGVIPDGAMRELAGLDRLPEGHGWTFVAPDEDLVVAAMCVQLNALIPRIQQHRVDDHLMRLCRWKQTIHEGDPPGGFPIFSPFDGTVTHNGPASKAPPTPKPFKKKNLSPREIDETLSRYFGGEDSR